MSHTRSAQANICSDVAVSNSVCTSTSSPKIVLNASDYGVPQNRQRVVFIGCRKDQKLITAIPATVMDEQKVSTVAIVEKEEESSETIEEESGDNTTPAVESPIEENNIEEKVDE